MLLYVRDPSLIAAAIKGLMHEFLYLLSGSHIWSKEKLGSAGGTGSRACFGSDRPGPSWFFDNRGQPRVYRMLEGPE